MSPAAFSISALFLALGATMLVVLAWRRNRRAHHALAQSIHDRSLALDQRCDELGAAVDRLALGQQIDHLDALARRCRATDVLSATAGSRVDAAIFAIRREIADGAHRADRPSA